MLLSVNDTEYKLAVCIDEHGLVGRFGGDHRTYAPRC